MILYSDLDEVLVSPIRSMPDAEGMVPIVPRPGADRFLADLTQHGDVVLLSHGTQAHVARGIEMLGDGARYLRGVITREDLDPIQAQIDVVEKSGLPEQTKLDLYQEIPPIFEPGFVFDDFAVGTWMYALKGIATATPPERWIQVEPFMYPKPDRGGLRKAYLEFTRRLAAWNASLSGRTGTKTRRKGA